MKQKLSAILSLALVLTMLCGMIPMSAAALPANANSAETKGGEAFNTPEEIEDMTPVELAISKLSVASLADREPVVYARRLYTKLSAADKENVRNYAQLLAAEAQILRLWILDLNEGTAEAPEISFGTSFGLWVLFEELDGMNDTQKAIVGEDAIEILEGMQAYESDVLLPAFKADYDLAKAVDKAIMEMDPANTDEVAATRAAYDGLTSFQKTIVVYYDVLKKAEGIDGVIPENIKYVGTRASGYGLSYSKEDWQSIDDQLQGYFPDAESTYVWIVALLGGNNGPAGGCNVDVDFTTIQDEDGKYMGKTQAEWLSENIAFRAPNASQTSQIDFLNYFDENNINVYLQVESGYADMKTLMDILYDVYDITSHKSVKGFAIDVEWYYGVTEDSGIPVTDAMAQSWNEYLYSTWGAGYKLVLKHYGLTWLPPAYRGGETGEGYLPSEKIIFCDDSQSFGSMDGLVGGVYDENDVRDGYRPGFAPEFRIFADYFPENEIIYQIGYQPDRQWFYNFGDPVIKNFAVKMAEATNPNQNIGIAWVNFSIKDPLTFPQMLKTDAEKASAVNGLLNYLSATGSNNLVGRRLTGDRQPAVLGDALFVTRVRQLYDALTEDQKARLTASRVTRLLTVEPVALDVRIDLQIPAIEDLRKKDTGAVSEVWAIYLALTEDQKAAVQNIEKLLAARERIEQLNNEIDDMSAVEQAIDNLSVTSVADREAVVRARRLYTKLSSADKENVRNYSKLLTAEARMLKLWILDLNEGTMEAPAISFEMSQGLWALADQLSGMSDTQKAIIGAESIALLGKLQELRAGHLQNFKAQYNLAKAVDKVILAMDPANPEEVAAARAAYEGLTSFQKTAVLYYEVLKKAEGINDLIPANLKYIGTRASGYGLSYSKEDWQSIDDQLQGYAPDAESAYVWIVALLGGNNGPLGGCNIDVDFATIQDEDGKYMGKTQAEWLSENISFRAPNASQTSQIDFLNYFDENNINVYLQVESGFADMKTLMDILYDVYDVADHKCVKGFAIDVEWYNGVTEDSGLPVTDAIAQSWNEYLYSTWGAGYKLFLKHFGSTWLPKTYRGGETGEGYLPSEKLVFCNDAQGYGSMDGSVGGIYDDSAARDGDVMGAGSQFRLFADFYPENEIVLQIGYQPDRQWFYNFDDPIIKSFAVKLAENMNPNQDIGIAWVNFSIKDPLTFPQMLKTDAEKASAVNGLLNYLSATGTNNIVGRRLTGDRQPAVLGDALYVTRMRALYDALTEDQKARLTASRVTRLLAVEPVALDVRIDLQIPAIEDLREKDVATIYTVWDIYQALTEDQKAAVQNIEKLLAAKAFADGLAPVITQFVVNPGAIVGTLAANIKVIAVGQNLESAVVYLKDGESKIGLTSIAGGSVMIRVNAAPAVTEDTVYEVVAEANGVVLSVGTIVIKPYSTDIWTVSALPGAGNKLALNFNANLTAASTFGVTINGVAYAAQIQPDKRTVLVDVDYGALEVGTKILIKGVKYPELFPSYSFTFTVTK